MCVFLPFTFHYSYILNTFTEIAHTTFHLEGAVRWGCSNYSHNIDRIILEDFICVSFLCLSPHVLVNTIFTGYASLPQTARSSSWHARYTVLTYLQTMVFYNLFIFLNNEDAVKGIRWLVISLLEDEQLEVKFKLKQIEI